MPRTRRGKRGKRRDVGFRDLPRIEASIRGMAVGEAVGPMPRTSAGAERAAKSVRAGSPARRNRGRSGGR